MNSRQAKIMEDFKEAKAPEYEESVDKVISKMYTQPHPKNEMLICGLSSKGGVTKAFETEEELARHILQKYGEGWRDEICTIDVDGQVTKRRRVQDENFIADLKNYDYVGRKIIDRKIYSANADGNCCYHAYCSMIRD